MKVLMVGDGEHERAGALQTLVERLLERSIDAEFRFSRESPRLLIKGDGRGYFKKAISWLLEAQRRGFDALVFVIDHDGYPQRVTEFNDAQAKQDGQYSLPRALGVAIRSFDAWMLADQTALAAALNRVVDQFPDPETLRDPKANAKELLVGHLHARLSQRELYDAVARESELNVLKQRCPKGFGPFAARVRQLR